MLRLSYVVLSIAAMMACGLAGAPASAQESPPPETITAVIPQPSGGTGSGGGPADLSALWDVRQTPTKLAACTISPLGGLVFRSIGNTTIPAGTVIRWLVPSTKRYGSYVLGTDLMPGQSLTLAALVGPALDQAATCISVLGG